MNKILVTGGLGFIGQYVVGELNRRDIGSIPFDRVGEKYENYGFTGDIKDREAITDAITKVDGVIHLAGLLGTQEGVRRAQDYVDANITGSLNVFEAMRKYNKPGVFISVGNSWMNNPYSISKSAAERFALMYNEEFGTKIAIVRGLNAYGPGQKDYPVRKIIPSFVNRALAGDDIEIYGDGWQVMDMIYVEDLARILVNALVEDHGVYDEVINAGSGLRTSVNEIANRVSYLVGRDTQVSYLPMRPGEPEKSEVLADTRLLQKLEWMPEVSLNDGLNRTIEWARKSHL